MFLKMGVFRSKFGFVDGNFGQHDATENYNNYACD